MKIFNNIFVFVLGLFSAVFLLNPTLGTFEIPDILPVIGHLDEAAAALILLNCLAYFGFDVTRLVRKAQRKQAEKDDTVIDVDILKSREADQT